MAVHDWLVDLVGDTPLVRLHSVSRGIEAPVLAKVEYLNPGGSVKDRIALAMVEAAEREGLIGPGGTIVEPTSGNTGVGLALVAVQRGYKCLFTMPDKISAEKVNVLRAYGAEVIVCPTAVAPDDPRSYYSVARRLVRDTPGAWSPDQYSNMANPQAHYEMTGPEIGRRPTVVSPISWRASAPAGRSPGSAGISRNAIPPVTVVGADPVGSVYSGGTGRPYLVEGVGEDIWPVTYDPAVVDRVEAIDDKESFLLPAPAREEGLLVGGSCGLAVAAALRVARGQPADALIVVLLPDSGRGYLSKIFNDEWMYAHGFLTQTSDEPAVRDVLGRKGGGMPDLVHVHPEETVGDAISILREFGVSQMPVVKQEPPVRAAEVVGAVVERHLLDAVYSDRASVSEPVGQHMSPPLPTIGAGEPVSTAVQMLEKSSAALVLEGGDPVGILTRADLLGYLAAR